MSENVNISSDDLIISVDIGNTRTHVGLIDMRGEKCCLRIDFKSVDVLEQLVPSLRAITNEYNCPFVPPLVVASVIKSLDKEISTLLHSNHIAYDRFQYNEQLPLKIQYQTPKKLGVDRIADALFAFRTYPQDTVIIINTGTAIKVELLKRDEFMGGAIFPGIDAQLQSLHTTTDALPNIRTEGHFIIPGRSTEECMRGGVLTAISGALNHIVRKYSALSDVLPKILSTGGSWPLLEKEVNFPFKHVPDMTLIGIALFKKWNTY